MIEFRLISTWNDRFLSAVRAHYTKSSGPPPGKKLAWRVLEDGAHRGWLGLGEPTFKLAARRRLGLEDGRPLPLTVCNFIYRLDAEGATRASAILRQWHEPASVDWAYWYGWRPVHWETLVDPAEVGPGDDEHVAGYCFRRAGYRSLGDTTGRTARRAARLDPRRSGLVRRLGEAGALPGAARAHPGGLERGVGGGVTLVVLKAIAKISAIYAAFVVVLGAIFATTVWIADALKRRRR